VIGRKLGQKSIIQENRDALRRWVAVLASLYPTGADCEPLEYLAANFTFPEDTDAALIIFEYLTRPMLRLEHDLWGELNEDPPRENVKFELKSKGNGFLLDHLWLHFFEPNLDKLSDRIEPLIMSQLELVYILSNSDKGIVGAWDTLSLSRNVMEQHDHGRLNGGLGVLIDAAYDVITWNANNRPARCDALIELWFSGHSFLLKRLAIIAVAECKHWSADRKLKWVLDNDLLYWIGLKHEVFQVLKHAYPHSTEAQRKTIIDRANKGRLPVPEGSERTVEYEKYNLIYWIYQSDPDCRVARAEFEKMQAAHQDFATREHPDLDVEFGPVQMGLQSPLSVDELLSKRPAEHIEFFVSYDIQSPFGPNREGLLANVTTASTRNCTWSLELAKELTGREPVKSDLWSALVRAWASSELNDDTWEYVLQLLDENQQLLSPLADEISNLLEDGIKKTAGPIPSECLDVVSDLSRKLWAIVRQTKAPEPSAKEIDWVMRAINHPAGRLTLFWLNLLARRRREAGVAWREIPAELRETFETVLTDDSYAAGLALVLLASQFNFLFVADEQWTKTNVLPLFDWTLDGERAVRAFHGFLALGHQTEPLLPYLLPMYEKAFSHIAELGRVKDRFILYLAGLAVTSSVNPLANGWLDRFMVAAEPTDRRCWASEVGRFLRQSNETARAAVWQNWIKGYWDRRLSGLPVPLDASELGEMVEWSMHLGTGFPEVVDTISKCPPFEVGDTILFRDLADSKFPEAFPAATAKLLKAILANMKVFHFDFGMVESAVRRITPLETPRELLEKICNELSRLGYQSAATLHAWVRTQRAA
jgi:hypothetical protein